MLNKKEKYSIFRRKMFFIKKVLINISVWGFICFERFAVRNIIV